LIPLVAYGLFSAVVGFVAYHQHATYHHSIFGAKFDLGDPLFEYHSQRHFNGDGYSIEVYALPDAVRKRFEHPDAALLSELPMRPLERDRWATKTWRAAPVDPQFAGYVSFALALYNDQQNDSALVGHFDAVRAALAGRSAYYSFFYYDHSDGHPGDIDFFLVDLANGRLYIIDHNT